MENNEWIEFQTQSFFRSKYAEEMPISEAVVRQVIRYFAAQETRLSAFQEGLLEALKLLRKTRKTPLGTDNSNTELYKAGSGEMYFNEGIDYGIQAITSRIEESKKQ